MTAPGETVNPSAKDGTLKRDKQAPVVVDKYAPVVVDKYAPVVVKKEKTATMLGEELNSKDVPLQRKSLAHTSVAALAEATKIVGKLIGASSVYNFMSLEPEFQYKSDIASKVTKADQELEISARALYLIVDSDGSGMLEKEELSKLKQLKSSTGQTFDIGKCLRHASTFSHSCRNSL